MRRTLLALFLCAGIAGPQTFNQSNFSNGVRLLVGTSVPASCGPNDMFLKTDATPPSNLYLCPAGTFIQATGTAGAPSGNAGGDLGGTYPNPSVAQVGGVAAASVAAGANIANAATSANTNNAVVRRGASGEFSAGAITATQFNGSGTGLTSGSVPIAALATGDYAAKITSGSYGIYTAGLYTADNRAIAPSEDTSGKLRFGFTAWNNNSTSPYADYLHLRSYSDATGGKDNLVLFRKDAIGMRIYQQDFGSATAYSSYKDIAFTDGTNATGSWPISVTGSAGSVAWANVGSKPQAWLDEATLSADISSQDINTARPSGFYSGTTVSNAPIAGWWTGLHVRHSNSGNNYSFDLVWPHGQEQLYFRSKNDSVNGSWRQVLLEDNRTYGVNISGNAATASAVEWSAVNNKPAGMPPTGPAGGDLGGTYPNPYVAKIGGQPNFSFTDNTDQKDVLKFAYVTHGDELRWKTPYAIERHTGAAWETYSSPPDFGLAADGRGDTVTTIPNTTTQFRLSYNVDGCVTPSVLVQQEYPLATFNVTAEASTNGAAWSALGSATALGGYQNVLHLSYDECKSKIRLTFTITNHNGGTDFKLVNLMLLSTRPGGQGGQLDNLLPISWNYNKNVGIGAANPSYKLTIETAQDSNSALLYLKNTTATRPAYVAFKSAAQTGWVTGSYDPTGYVIAETDGATSAVSQIKLAVKAGGNVGIGAGNISPSSTLHVFDTTATTGVTKLTGQAGAGQSTTNLQEWKNNAGSTLGYFGSSGAFYASGTIYGNVYGNSSSTSNASISLAATGASITRNVGDANPALIVQQSHASSTGDILQVKNNSTTVLSVKQGGNILIGTTTDDGVNKLQVNGNVSATTFIGALSGNAATATNVAWTGVTGRPTALSAFTNDPGYITSAGTATNVSALAGTWTAISYFQSNKGNGATLAAHTAPSLQVYSTDGGAAFMSFHRSGSFAINFGLDPDNILRIGGWSAGQNLWSLDSAGNMATIGNMSAATFNSLGIHAGTNNEANKIVRTDGNGYIQAGWINTISGDAGAGAIARVYASTDGYIRYYTLANFMKQGMNAVSHHASFALDDPYLALPVRVTYGVFQPRAAAATITEVWCWSDGDAIINLRRSDGGDMINGHLTCGGGTASTNLNGYNSIPVNYAVGLNVVSNSSSKSIRVGFKYTTAY